MLTLERYDKILTLCNAHFLSDSGRRMTTGLQAEISYPDQLSAAEKELELRRMMRQMRRVLVAYSGGVDSTYLAFVASQELDANAVCVMGISPSVSEFQKREAADGARSGGFSFIEIETREMETASYVANPADRCYYCKAELFEKLRVLAGVHQADFVIDGTNADDLREHRPGRKAASERLVRSPLAELGFSKLDIRERSRVYGLVSADRPASPCLSSRIAHGIPITVARLSAVERGEQILRDEGFQEFRVRLHADLARIEIARKEIVKALDPIMFERLGKRFKRLGFKYITLDLEGFRSGSMNGNVQFGTKPEEHQKVELENV